MDAFFASVEQRDNPAYRDKPLVVGGSPQSRGVVAAASYEARRYGIRSAMSCAEAYRRCGKAVFVPPRIAVYRRISRVIMAIFRDFSDLVEPLSLDEAYIDVTRNHKAIPYASQVAKEMLAKIYNYTGLTASAGVAENKFLAKLASNHRKPCGLTVLQPKDVEAFLLPLSVAVIPGIGRVAENKLAQIGIVKIWQLQKQSQEDLVNLFGKSGAWFYHAARGLDGRPVCPHRERKSIGAEDTFERDTLDVKYLHEKIAQHATRIFSTLDKKCVYGRTLTLKVKYHDFVLCTRSKTFETPILTLETLLEAAIELLTATEAGSRAIRLLGISVSNFGAHSVRKKTESSSQLCLGF